MSNVLQTETTVKDLVDHLILEGDSMSAFQDAVLEHVKGRMCDGYCKFPAQYSAKGNDANYEKLLNEVCESCPMNAL